MWLNGREQRVQVNGRKSMWGKGNKLGPSEIRNRPITSHCLYINNLVSKLSSNINKSADNTEIGRQITSEQCRESTHRAVL